MVNIMSTLQQVLLAFVSGYVISGIFKLSYNDSIYVACVSAAVPLIPLLVDTLKRRRS